MLRCSLTSLCALLTLATVAVAQEMINTNTSNWKSGGVCYEIFVRSFFDSDGDGIGDLKGLTEKLDYINDGDPNSRRDLGAQCVWLMPVAQSPSYHGYDVTNYYRINRDYGTNDEFKLFVFEAHRRGIRVLVDLVLNHMSSEHPFFKDALRNPDSPYRDWFLWSPQYPSVQSPWGGEIWHRSEVRDEYYYGLFWGGMPDLNYANPEVREEAKRIAHFWLDDMGVDGFRLDAVKHLMEDGGMVEHVPATHDVLREFGGYVRSVAPEAFTIGEVWDSIGAMLPYYPDQLDAHFAFEAANAIIDAVRIGSARGLLTPFVRLQRELPADRWSPFLRNHDQTRTLTELGGDVAKAKLAATLLLTLPGLPFVYYGEEIGMTGDKPDPRLRTPMHWRRARAAGFTSGVAWEPLQRDSLTANVEAQDEDPNSLLNLYRSLIHLRASNAALGAGQLLPLTANTESVTAFLRRHEERTVMVLANLSGIAISSVSVSSDAGELPAGRYQTENLLGGPAAFTVTVQRNGRIDGLAPVQSLAPFEFGVFEMTRAGR